MNLNGGRWMMIALAVLGHVATTAAQAIPAAINYQGRIEADGVAFTGIGSFKFAIMDEAGTTPLWTNDGAYPIVETVEAVVTEGLFSVILGASDGMAPIPAAVFDEENVQLRVWFDDGVNGMEQLAPDQPLVSVGYAYRATRASDADKVDGIDAAELEESNEIDDDIAAHASQSDAHHEKTTSFTELADTATDAQIPDSITVNYAATAGDANTLDGHDSSEFVTSASESWVDESGDTMTGHLVLPYDGLTLGVTQLVTAFNSVGIGVTTPLAKLHVNGQPGNSAFRVEVEDVVKFLISSNGGTAVGTVASAPPNGLYVHGDTGLGTNFPETKLHVMGDIILDYALRADDASGLAFQTDDAVARMTILDNGYVGINTTSPTRLFHVKGDIQIDETIYADDQSGLRFATDDGVTRLTIADDGYVGIGTTSPTSPLHVNGDITVDDTIIAEDAAGLHFATDDGATRMTIDDDGDVGIGVAPGNHRLYVESSSGGVDAATGYFRNASSTGLAMSLDNESTNATLLLSQRGSGNLISGDSWVGGWHRVFVVMEDGTTGIGDSSPDAKLDVEGDISTGDIGIRWKLLTGTTGNSQATAVYPGVDVDNIVAVDYFIWDDINSEWVQNPDCGLEMGTNYDVIYILHFSSSFQSQPYKVFIMYHE